MNKKFLCGALACMMALTSIFGVTGCKDKELNQGQTGNGNENSGGSTGNQGSTIKPGTVITDESVKTDLYGALSNANLTGFTYSASATLDVAEGESTQIQKIVAEGAAVVKDSVVEADVFAYLLSDPIAAEPAEDGLETGDEGQTDQAQAAQYFLYFLRNDAMYSVSGDWKGEGTVSVAELKAQLKSEKEPLVLTKETADDSYLSALQAPAVMKLAKNIPSLFDGIITKTEGGYSLKFDLMEGVGALFDGIGSLATAIDTNAQITLSGLFGQPFLKTTLDKLLNGITAEELVDTVKPMLPEEIAASLPKPSTTGTASKYVENLLRSGSFYKAITGDDEEWKDWKTFAEVPFATIAKLITGEEVSFGDLKLKEMLDELETRFEKEIVTMLLGFIDLDDGEISDEDFSFSVEFAFDEDKKLLGFSMDGLATGSRTSTGETDGQDGSDSEMNGQGGSDSETDGQGGSDSDMNGQGGSDSDMNGQGGSATQKGSKATARGIIKMEAACASAPELFELAGCKVYGENGKISSIKAAK